MPDISGIFIGNFCREKRCGWKEENVISGREEEGERDKGEEDDSDSF